MGAKSLPFDADSLLQRIEEKSIPVPESGCWLWQGTTCKHGYGLLSVDGNYVRAHRLSWELHNGASIGSFQVMHKCDTRNCVNPTHLVLGTLRDNMRDMVSKGRSAWGERSAKAKLTSEQVRSIRRMHSAGGVSQIELAKQVGVNPSTISDIIARVSWKGLQP